LSSVGSSDSYVYGVLPGLLVTALGCGLTLPALTVVALSGTSGSSVRVSTAANATASTAASTSGIVEAA
ncbi:hypothetical protein, partial [Nocardia cyriacigeorgica]